MLLTLLLLACPPTDEAADGGAGDGGGSDGGGSDGGGTEVARWNFLVFMNGDNNLESYVVHDLNELEEVGSGDGVNVLVQADRIEGFDSRDGDWTGTRRYLVTQDSDPDRVGSTLLEDLGERDLGDPAELAEFLDWASTEFPAERTVLILWDHGDSWALTSGVPQPPSISSDDSSGSIMSIAEGELTAALAPWVEAHGPLDLLGFDACLMASWEVAHSLVGQADLMLGSELSVGWEGFRYAPALASLRGDEALSPEDLSRQMVNDMVAEGTEWGETAIDLRRIDALSSAIDALAGLVLDDAAALVRLAGYLDQSRGCHKGWERWYLDLGDLLDVIDANEGDSALATAAVQARLALDESVLAVQGAGPYEWITGLTIFSDTTGRRALGAYVEGSWAEDTRWDEVLWTQVE